MIVGWIRTSIDAKVRSTITFVPEAHKLWETLRLRFSVRNRTRVHQLQDEIINCKQDGQSVLEYYGRLSKLWEELQNLKSGRPCTCAASADIEKNGRMLAFISSYLVLTMHDLLQSDHELRMRSLYHTLMLSILV